MRQVTQSVKFMQAMIVLLIIGGVIIWVAIEMGKPAGGEYLKVEVADLRSNVSTDGCFYRFGHLLAPQLESGGVEFHSQRPRPRIKAGVL